MKRRLNGSTNGTDKRLSSDTNDQMIDGARYSSLRYREDLINVLCGLDSGSIVLIATELGMGRQELMRDLANAFGNTGYCVEYYPCDVSEDPSDAGLRLMEMVDACVQSGSDAVVVIDNYPVSNAVCLEPLDSIVQQASEAGISVYVGSLPEGEVLFDGGVDVVTFWSSDLLLTGGGNENPVIDHEYIQGIPILAFESAKAYSANITLPIHSPSYMTTYSKLVSHTQRMTLTREERIACACMMLLGYGTIDELREIAGNIDTETFQRFARDEPILGVNSQQMTFSCVGSRDVDAVTTCMHAFAGNVNELSELLPDIAGMLMGRDDAARAAQVCAGIPDKLVRCRLVLRYHFPFLNAGMIRIVAESCGIVSEEHYPGIVGLYECRSVLNSLLHFGRYEGISMLDHISTNTVRGRYAELCMACREQLRGKSARSLLKDRQGDDELSHGLVVHGKALAHIADGDIVGARNLVTTVGLQAGVLSVISLLLVADDLFCSIMCGDVVGDGGDDYINELLGFVGDALPQHHSFRRLIDTIAMLIRVARVLAGERDDAGDFDIAYHQAVSQQDTMLCGAFLLGAAVAELRHRHWEGSVVRLDRAMDCFMKVGADFYSHICSLLRYMLHVAQGGPGRAGVLERCMGDTMEMDVLIIIVESVATGKPCRDLGAMGLEGALCMPPTSIMWVLSTVLTCFGDLSARVFEALPAPWASACGRHLEAWGFTEDAWSQLEPTQNSFVRAARALGANDAVAVDCPVRIRMLGGFDVWVCGKPVSDRELEPRRAKLLLALLVCKPAHWTTYKECQDNIWRETMGDDFNKLKKKAANAVGVLRSVLEIDPGRYGVDSVVAHSYGIDGRIKLEESLVAFDVDQFEAAAKKIVGSNTDVYDVVTLGRIVEDLYVGDLYVFPDIDITVVNERRVDLSGLYVDAMQVATVAARDTRQLTCACRFARNAYMKCDAREDLLTNLVTVLAEANRRKEAKGFFDAYVHKQGVTDDLRELGTALFGEGERYVGVRAYDTVALAGIEIVDEKTWKKKYGPLYAI